MPERKERWLVSGREAARKAQTSSKKAPCLPFPFSLFIEGGTEPMGVRSTVKAIILDRGKILLNQCYDEVIGTYYSLPGGGQNQYETMHDALVRECAEETGYRVEPVRFAALLEEINTDAALRSAHPDYAHKMLHVFVCRLASPIPTAPTERDVAQVRCEWIPLGAMHTVNLLPEVIGEHMRELTEGETPLFLGSHFLTRNHG